MLLGMRGPVAVNIKEEFRINAVNQFGGARLKNNYSLFCPGDDQPHRRTYEIVPDARIVSQEFCLSDPQFFRNHYHIEPGIRVRRSPGAPEFTVYDHRLAAHPPGDIALRTLSTCGTGKFREEVHMVFDGMPLCIHPGAPALYALYGCVGILDYFVGSYYQDHLLRAEQHGSYAVSSTVDIHYLPVKCDGIGAA